jgi:hypothetical protein
VGDFPGTIIESAADGPYIAAVNATCSSSETHANANLIAAAPDLLAACERLTGIVHGLRQVRRQYGKALNEAAAAIARAKGIQP